MTEDTLEKLKIAALQVQKANMSFADALAKHDACLKLNQMQLEAEFRMQVHEALDQILDGNADCARLLRQGANEG